MPFENASKFPDSLFEEVDEVNEDANYRPPHDESQDAAEETGNTSRPNAFDSPTRKGAVKREHQVYGLSHSLPEAKYIMRTTNFDILDAANDDGDLSYGVDSYNEDFNWLNEIEGNMPEGSSSSDTGHVSDPFLTSHPRQTIENTSFDTLNPQTTSNFATPEYGVPQQQQFRRPMQNEHGHAGTLPSSNSRSFLGVYSGHSQQDRLEASKSKAEGDNPFGRFGHFINIFPSLEAARKLATEHLESRLRFDSTIPQTQEQHIAVVERLYMAIMNIRETHDYQEGTGKLPLAYEYFAKGKYTMGQVQAVCWELLELCKIRHQRGILLPTYHRVPKSVLEYDTFEDRLRGLCNALRNRKTICKRIMDPLYIMQLVDSPDMYVSRAAQNQKLNANKGVQISTGRNVLKRKLEADGAQGAEYSGTSRATKRNCSSTRQPSLRQWSAESLTSSTIKNDTTSESPPNLVSMRSAPLAQDFTALLDPDLRHSGDIFGQPAMSLEMNTNESAHAMQGGSLLAKPSLGVHTQQDQGIRMYHSVPRSHHTNPPNDATYSQPSPILGRMDRLEDLNEDEQVLVYIDAMNADLTLQNIRTLHARGLFVRQSRVYDAAGSVIYPRVMDCELLCHLHYALHENNQGKISQQNPPVNEQRQQRELTASPMAQPYQRYLPESQNNRTGPTSSHHHSAYIATQSAGGNRGDPSIRGYSREYTQPLAKGISHKRKTSDDGAY